MGLMDNVKNAQEMAEQAQKMAAQQQAGGLDMSGGALGGTEQMQWINRVASEGLDGEGTITSIKETGNADPAGAKEFEIQVDATIDGESMKATAMQFLHAKSEGAYKEGKKFELKADPDDKSRVLLMGGLD